MMTPRAHGPTPFVVLGKARCGSTYLMGLLNSHPGILAFGELFRDEDAIGWDLPPYDVERQSPELIEKMRSDPVRFLEEDVLEHRLNLDAVGFKLFYYHAQGNARLPLWTYLQSRMSLRVIHLKRYNTLRELLSLRLAERTDEWYATVETGNAPAPIELEYADCVREFEYARDTKEHFDRFFQGSAVFELSYESLVQNVDSETERVERFLGVEPLGLSPLTVKQTKLPLSEAISNYGELKSAFRGSCWAAFFED